MAKYTELFSEYLENGGELPAIFDYIQGFKELFIGEFADREIGFETPSLFALKLETRANLIVPAYEARIDELLTASKNLVDPRKRRVRSGSTQREYGERNYTDTNERNGQIQTIDNSSRTFDQGAQYTTEKDFPFVPTQDPSASESDYVTRQTKQNSETDSETTNNSSSQMFNNLEDSRTYNEEMHTDNELYNNITDEETGISSSEALALWTALNNQVWIVKRELLREFNTLFMVVY